MNNTLPPPASRTYIDGLVHFTLRWTPRTIVAGVSGYYCLGIAYEVGIMAAIDRIGIRILRPSLGYMAIAAVMPTFQWYSAWGVRVCFGLTATLIYYLIEKILGFIYSTLFPPPPTLNPALNRSSIDDRYPGLKKALEKIKQRDD